MLELTVIAGGDDWILVDEEDGELGRFASRAQALSAACDYANGFGCEVGYVLMQTEDGDWEELLVEAPALH